MIGHTHSNTTLNTSQADNIELLRIEKARVSNAVIHLEQSLLDLKRSNEEEPDPLYREAIGVRCVFSRWHSRDKHSRNNRTSHATLQRLRLIFSIFRAMLWCQDCEVFFFVVRPYFKLGMHASFHAVWNVSFVEIMLTVKLIAGEYFSGCKVSCSNG